MDALITNLSADPVFIAGPNLELDAIGGTNAARSWPDISIAELDGSPHIKQLVIDGTISVTLTDDATDLAVTAAGNLSAHALPTYPVATLPTGFDGRVAFASDGRAGAEGGGSGTGTMVVFSDSSWRRVEDLAVVAA